MESITLYCKEGSSDKVYKAAIEPGDGGYCVDFAFGRRGSTLCTGSKTPVAVSYRAAKTIYDKLVREKQAKGYTPGETGTLYDQTEHSGRFTGILPQLLNPIAGSKVRQFIKDPAYLMQEKMDGKRLLLRKEGAQVTGINRHGLAVGIPRTMTESMMLFPGDLLLDGEAIGASLWAFDLLKLHALDLRETPYRERLHKLIHLLAGHPPPHICCVKTAYQAKDKKHLFEELQMAGKEGVVFKHLEAPWTSGRPASGGTQLKFKFWHTASFIVSDVDHGRSISLELLLDRRLVMAGCATVPPNHGIPQVGQVVECRYLYAFRESGCIYQPVYLGIRDDVAPEACTVDQLAWKPS